MMHRTPRGRSGITLTEILISIMIMGIGLVSLATLFPLGLLRLRNASRDSRSTLMIDTAHSEIQARGLFSLNSFIYSWYATGYADKQVNAPWTFDPVTPYATDRGRYLSGMPPVGVVAWQGNPGLPVVYDPLFWATIDYTSGGTSSPRLAASREAARFGSGIGLLRDDPTGGISDTPSAHGLQRITNFMPATAGTNGLDDNGIGGVDDSFEVSWPLPYAMPSATIGAADVGPDLVGEIFASPDDPVFQKDGPPNISAGTGSTLVPDLSTGSALRDYAYTWFFTGRQVSAGEFTQFDGSIVVCHNRAFGLDPVATPSGTVMVATGDRVVEAVWAWSKSVEIPAGLPAGYPRVGYSRGDDRVVLLRWPDSSPDPNVPVGSWIADVTYERVQNVANERFNFLPPALAHYPAQRCDWYQVIKRGDVQVDPDVAGHRRMIVTVNNSVRAKTLLDANGDPVRVNAALISPSVVNVFPYRN